MNFPIVQVEGLPVIKPHRRHVRITHQGRQVVKETDLATIKAAETYLSNPSFSVTQVKGMYGTCFKLGGLGLSPGDELIRLGRGKWELTHHRFSTIDSMDKYILATHGWLELHFANGCVPDCKFPGRSQPGHVCEKVEVLVPPPPSPAVVAPMPPAPAAPAIPANANTPPPSAPASAAVNTGLDDEDESDSESSIETDFGDIHDDEDEQKSPLQRRRRSEDYIERIMARDDVDVVIHEVVRPDGSVDTLFIPLKLDAETAKILLLQRFSFGSSPRTPPKVSKLEVEAVAKFAIRCGTAGITRLRVLRHFGPWGPNVDPRTQPNFSEYDGSWDYIKHEGHLAHAVKRLGYKLVKMKRPNTAGTMTSTMSEDGEHIYVAEPQTGVNTP